VSGRTSLTRAAIVVIALGSTGVVVTALYVAASRANESRRAVAERQALVRQISYGEPIAAEWEVFRTSAANLAIDPAGGDRRPAHPRTLARYQLLRAYPGAPPRIPHGLTPEESQSESCNTCHERGGYSERFGAYVPVTPHPELTGCLGCHIGDAPLMAVPLPGTDPNARCRQCHTIDALRRQEASGTWRPLPWPELTRASVDGAPPPIPHGRDMRGNCLACHAAPAAVAEIATKHPERANCRQCHLELDP
jgi:nitrate reductase (cytochrome), electron transfer subunit